eukprot:1381074-Amorphochlora_amoeboformis.AAC.2
MECLHRFCAVCIELSLRMGKKECPSCRTKCPSKVAYHTRPRISRIYPKPIQLAKNRSYQTYCGLSCATDCPSPPSAATSPERPRVRQDHQVGVPRHISGGRPTGGGDRSNSLSVQRRRVYASYRT